jgi:hypothetical protein
MTTPWAAIVKQLQLNEDALREHANGDPMDQDCMRYAGTVEALAMAERQTRGEAFQDSMLEMAKHLAKKAGFPELPADLTAGPATDHGVGTGVGNRVENDGETRP